MASSVRKSKSRKNTLYSMEPEHHSISVRKIDNGFVVSTMRSDAKGYKSTEQYHERKPLIDIQSVPRLDAKPTESKVTVAALRKATGTKKVNNT